MPSIQLTVNGTSRTLDMDPSTPLLWALRDGLGLTGTKFGCGIAMCGACTVLIDGREPIRSCVTPLGDVAGKKITTIEGLGRAAHPVQAAWIAEEVPQCGYCQSGMILEATALLAAKPRPTDADIDVAFGGHVCRCGTYQRIRSAIHRAASTAGGKRGAP